MSLEILNLNQGSLEWHAFRKTKITATDASIILGVNPWKTPLQLYHEKKSNDEPKPPTERMQRGIDLEPVARFLFNSTHNCNAKPVVLVRDWTMASLDGMTETGDILEIKCPGEKDHNLAIQGIVPEYYYPQLQHQMYVAGTNFIHYCSYNGFALIDFIVKRDENFIKNMLIEEKKFYDFLINNIPPEPTERDYIQRNDDLWNQRALRYAELNLMIERLEKEREEVKNELVLLSGGSSSKGGGISLRQVMRKGFVDYEKIPELKEVNLELYRKPAITTWRIICQ